MKLKELAEQLGVSSASISIVRQGKTGVSAATRRKIEIALAENGYSYIPFIQRTYPEVRSFSNEGSGGKILLLKYYSSALLTDQNEGFVESIIDAVSASVKSSGYALELVGINSTEYAGFLSALIPANYVGMLVIATEMTEDDLCLLASVKLPIVVMDTDYACIPQSSVSMNNRRLAFEAVRELSDAGEVGFLRSAQQTGNFHGRYLGYLEAIHAQGLPDGPDLQFTLTPSLKEATLEMEKYLQSGRRIPKALFAGNDVIAIGCIKALRKNGIRVPEDVRIIGVDDTLLSQVISPSLSSMQIPKTDLGVNAIVLLLNRIQDPAAPNIHLRLDAQLIRRHSSRKT